MKIRFAAMQLSLLALAICAPAMLSAQDIQVSPPLERVSSFTPVPDGSGVVYRVEQAGGTHSDLFHSRLGLPSAAHDLQDVQSDFFPGGYAVSPDSRRLVYLTSAAIEYVVVELFSQPLDGSVPPVKLNGPLGAQGDVTKFLISPDSERVLFFTYDQDLGQSRVFTAPLDGSAAPVEIDGPAPFSSSSPRISPDGQHVLYETVSGYLQLWSAPMDGGSPAELLPGRSSYTSQFQFTPDGSRVLYCTSLNANPNLFVELFSAPLDGSSAPIRINPALVSGGNVERQFALTPDGTRVIYGADQEVNGRLEIYIAPVDGSAAPLELSGPIGSTLPRPDPQAWGVTTNGTRAFYRGFRQTQGGLGLFLSVPLDASTPPVQLLSYLRGQAIPAQTVGRSRVLYQDASAFYSMPDDGSAPAIRLTPPLVAGGSFSTYQLDPRGLRLLYLADQEVDGRRELYWVPLDGSSPARKVNSELPAGGQVSYSYGFTRDGNRVAYLADVHQAGVQELFFDFLTPPYRAR